MRDHTIKTERSNWSTSHSSFLNQIRIAYHTEIILYRRYHTNQWNWLIHCATVPLEFFAWFLLVPYLDHRIVSLVHMFSWICALYYWILGISWHSLSSGLMMVFLYHAGIFFHHRLLIMFFLPIWMISLLLQVTAWFFQVYIGHHLLEHNHPAMTKKLTLNSIVLSLRLAWDTDTIT